MTGWLVFRTSIINLSLLGVRRQGLPPGSISFKWVNTDIVKDCEWTYLKMKLNAGFLGKNPSDKPLAHLISLGVFV